MLIITNTGCASKLRRMLWSSGKNRLIGEWKAPLSTILKMGPTRGTQTGLKYIKGVDGKSIQRVEDPSRSVLLFRTSLSMGPILSLQQPSSSSWLFQWIWLQQFITSDKLITVYQLLHQFQARSKLDLVSVLNVQLKMQL